jgi:hypothetical protein
MSKKDVSARIVMLSLSISPAAVFRGVVAIVVDPIQRLTGRALAHVFKECRVIVPPITYFDAATTVPVVFGLGFAEASIPHTHPDPVGERRFLSSLSDAVLGWYFPAPTGLRVSVSKRMRGYLRLFSAVTQTVPIPTVFPAMGKRQNCKFSKSLTGKVGENAGHLITSILVNNHWRARRNGVIEFPRSAAKPIYARVF